MAEYGNAVGQGAHIAGSGGGHATGGSSGFADGIGSTLSGLVHDASRAAAGLPPEVLAVLLVVCAGFLLLVLRRAF